MFLRGVRVRYFPSRRSLALFSIDTDNALASGFDVPCLWCSHDMVTLRWSRTLDGEYLPVYIWIGTQSVASLLLAILFIRHTVFPSDNWHRIPMFYDRLMKTAIEHCPASREKTG